MGDLLDKDGVYRVPPTFKNMFKKSAVKSVSYHFYAEKSMFRDDGSHTATVRIEDGSASIKQNFFSDDENDLVKQVEEFINNLKN